MQIPLKIFFSLAAPDLSCSMCDLQLWHAGSSSLTEDQTQGSCIGSTES